MIEAEIISIGNELLQGRMDDTNATHISQRLTQLGAKVRRRSTCGDGKADIAETLRTASERADIVIVTGGLGPTVDDTTIGAIAEMAGVELVPNSEVEIHVRKFYEMIGVPFQDNALRQTLMPSGAKVFMNPVGTAPCILFKHGRADMAFFPGVPREMKAMLEAALERLLSGRGAGVAVARTLRVFGVGESNLEAMLPTEITTSENPSFSFLPADYEVHLRLTARGKTTEICEALLDKTCFEIYKHVGSFIYGEGGESLERIVNKELARRGMTLACAESLTGGMVAARIVNVPGASNVLKGGIVAYNDEAKAELLGVSRETLEKHGAVSEQAALEMARGALKRFGADVGVSTTGNAGPDAQGGAPVGQVYVAVAFADESIKPQTANRRTVRDRNAVRTISTLLALDLLRRSLLR